MTIQRGWTSWRQLWPGSGRLLVCFLYSIKYKMMYNELTCMCLSLPHTHTQTEINKMDRLSRLEATVARLEALVHTSLGTTSLQLPHLLPPCQAITPLSPPHPAQTVEATTTPFPPSHPPTIPNRPPHPATTPNRPPHPPLPPPHPAPTIEASLLGHERPASIISY